MNSIHVLRWCTYLKERGNSVHLISFVGDVFTINRNKKKIPVIYDKLNISVNPIPGFTTLKNIFKGRLFRTIVINAEIIFTYCKLIYIVQKIKPDVIHAHYISLNGYWASKIDYHPLVLTAWGSDILSYPMTSRKAKMAIENMLEAADAITCATHNMYGIIQRNYRPGSKLKLVRWGIDTLTFHRGYQEAAKDLRRGMGIPEDSPVVLTSRGMKELYGNHYLLEAVPDVLKLNSKVHFIFIRGYGTKLYEDKIKNRAKELGVLGNLRFIEKLLDPSELAVYMNLADISTSFVPYGQFGAIQLESMNCGCVQLASDIDVHREKLVHMKNALLVDVNNKKEIANMIIYYTKHPEIKEEYYIINHELIEKTESWQKNAKSMEDLYQSLIKSSK